MKLINQTLVFLFFSFFTLEASSQSARSIFFYEIDDVALVYVDGEKVYESDVVGDLGGVEIEVDISKYITTGEEEVTIELLNVPCLDCTSNPWAINFEVLEGDESMDYQYDKGEGRGGNEPVYTYTLYWNDLY